MIDSINQDLCKVVDYAGTHVHVISLNKGNLGQENNHNFWPLRRGLSERCH